MSQRNLIILVAVLALAFLVYRSLASNRGWQWSPADLLKMGINRNQGYPGA